MRKTLVTALLLGTLSLTAYAGSLSTSDQTAVEGVITNQLTALEANRRAEAFSYATPILQKMFKSPDIFMGMVQQGYAPLLNPQSYKFGDSFVDPQGRPAQRVMITADDGKRYEAVYYMEQQEDGSWKIGGCTLLEIPGAEA